MTQSGLGVVLDQRSITSENTRIFFACVHVFMSAEVVKT